MLVLVRVRTTNFGFSHFRDAAAKQEEEEEAENLCGETAHCNNQNINVNRIVFGFAQISGRPALTGWGIAISGT